METPEFARAIERLIAMARTKRIAILCAEAVPWRCHRSLIADSLLARGHAVSHIMSPTNAKPHKLTSFARVRGTQVTYPGLIPSEQKSSGTAKNAESAKKGLAE
jgi:uncharacterized protein (DUF488 family)